MGTSPAVSNTLAPGSVGVVIFLSIICARAMQENGSMGESV